MGHYKNCKICALSTEIRDYIEESVKGGGSAVWVASQYPDRNINATNVQNHMKHADIVESEKYSVDKLRKKLEDLFSANGNLEEFFEELSPQLQEIIVTATFQCQKDLYNGYTRGAKDSASILKNVLESLDYITGFKARISVDAAIETLTKQGYIIQDNPNSQTAILRQQHRLDTVTFEDFQKYNSSNTSTETIL